MTKNNTPDQTAFFRTLAAGDHDRIRAIVSAELQILDCFDCSQFGATPLTWACFSGRTDLVELLIELVAGADTVFDLLMDRGAQCYPWFLDDARDACAGRFDQVSIASKDQRLRILSRLAPTQA